MFYRSYGAVLLFEISPQLALGAIFCRPYRG